MTGGELDERLEKRAREILDLLSEPTARRGRWFLRNPELRKNLDRLQTAVRDVQRLRRENALKEEHEEPLVQLLLSEEKAEAYNADSLGLLLESVDQLLVEAGDAKLVCALLEIEYARDAAEGGGEIPTWSTLFCDRLQTSKEFAKGKNVDLTSAKRRLSLLLRARHSLYALRRARSATKATRLFWLAPALAALVVALIALAAWVGEDASWGEGLLVAVAGAVGATLAAVFKLRDALPRLGDLRTFWYTFPLQIPLGAVAGLFLWLVLESGLVDVAGGEDWAAAAVLAFAAGFSEPFLLKTLERITGGQREAAEDGATRTTEQPG
ncbi:MAG: hypothetical protein ACRDNI_04580 [Gaiellaceae bacterium]